MTDEYVPADQDAAITLAVDGCRVLAGAGPRHIEYSIYTEIMGARLDVGAYGPDRPAQSASASASW